jgi:Spy/CpxP family protein refolding chaperone
MTKTKTTIGILTVVSMVALAAVAFAQGGYGRHMGAYGDRSGTSWDCDGPRMGGTQDGRGENGTGYGRGHGRNRQNNVWAGLSEEDAAKLKAARDQFRSNTKALRDTIERKQLDLRQEMRNDDPDTEKAVSLQKEVSQLRAEFDQKAFAHRLEMRKLLPEDFEGQGFGRKGFGRGYGKQCR